MKSKSKKRLFLLILYLLVFPPVSNLKAQSYSQHNLNSSHELMNLTRALHPDSKSPNIKTHTNAAHKFHITFRNDCTIVVKTRIEDLYGSDFLTVKRKGEMYIIRPENTVQISRVDVEGNKFVGIAADSCWLFKIRSGKINAYSPFAEYDIRGTIAIQKGDGEIKPLLNSVVRELFSDDAEALLLAEKGKLGEAIGKYNGIKEKVYSRHK